jgi:putative membrane protein
MDAKSKATEAKLKMLSGGAFDKAYIKAMVADHQEDLAKFKKEIATTQNSDLKSSVEQGEKTIAEHLHMAEQPRRLTTSQ